MSIYNVNYPNAIDLRSRDLITKELHVWNPATDAYERVMPGGGGGTADIPYYLQANSIEMKEEGDRSIQISTDGVVFSQNGDTETVSYETMSSLRQQFSELAYTKVPEIQDRVYEVESGLSPIKEKTDAFTIVDGRLVINKPINLTAIEDVGYVTGAMKALTLDLDNNRVGYTNVYDDAWPYITLLSNQVAALEEKTSNVATSGSQYCITLPGTGKTARMLLNSIALHVYHGDSTSIQHPLAALNPTGLTFTNSTGAVSEVFGLTDIQKAKALQTVTTTTANTNLDVIKPLKLTGTPALAASAATTKMLTMDTSTKQVSYTDIPTAGSNIQSATYFKALEYSFKQAKINTNDNKYYTVTEDTVNSNRFPMYQFPKPVNEFVLDLGDIPMNIKNIDSSYGKMYAFAFADLALTDVFSVKYTPADNDVGATNRLDMSVFIRNVKFNGAGTHNMVILTITGITSSSTQHTMYGKLLFKNHNVSAMTPIPTPDMIYVTG